MHSRPPYISITCHDNYSMIFPLPHEMRESTDNDVPFALSSLDIFFFSFFLTKEQAGLMIQSWQ